MMYEEFQKLTGKDCSFDEFEKWEKLYMGSDMDKQQFCEMVQKAVTPMPKKPSNALVRRFSRYGFDSGDDKRFSIFEVIRLSVSTGKMYLKNTGREMKEDDCHSMPRFDSEYMVIAK